jgi:oligopeptide transport system substrate-binding protein
MEALPVRRYLSKSTAAVIATALVAIALGGCVPNNSSTGSQSVGVFGPAKGGILSYFIQEPPGGIEPYGAYDSEGIQVEQALFDSLTAIDPKTHKVIPAAADSWSSNASGTVWTFKLHPGAKFADGESVTANDFVYSWNRIAESPAKEATNASQLAYHLEPIVGFEAASSKGVPMSGLKALDSLTLQVSLKYPFADWPDVCAHPSLAPVPQKLVESGVDYNGTKVPFSDMPVGNGPFKMSAPWKHNQYINVVRNDDYYGTKAHLDGVDFKIFKDVDTAYREFLAGTLDFTEIP